MVYVIEAKNGNESTFKIGYTVKQRARDRLMQIQRSNPLDLSLVAGIFGNETDEKAFHSIFKPHRIHGEWFTDCPGIRLLIQDFPYSRYVQLEHGFIHGDISFEDFFLEATPLKLEEPEVIERVLKQKGKEWRSP